MTYSIARAPIAVTIMSARAERPGAYAIRLVAPDLGRVPSSQTADLLSKSIRESAKEIARRLKPAA